MEGAPSQGLRSLKTGKQLSAFPSHLPRPSHAQHPALKQPPERSPALACPGGPAARPTPAPLLPSSGGTSPRLRWGSQATWPAQPALSLTRWRSAPGPSPATSVSWTRTKAVEAGHTWPCSPHPPPSSRRVGNQGRCPHTLGLQGDRPREAGMGTVGATPMRIAIYSRSCQNHHQGVTEGVRGGGSTLIKGPVKSGRRGTGPAVPPSNATLPTLRKGLPGRHLPIPQGGSGRGWEEV